VPAAPVAAAVPELQPTAPEPTAEPVAVEAAAPEPMQQ
jgi:hypothetical protein